jgi:hypothetical protein
MGRAGIPREVATFAHHFVLGLDHGASFRACHSVLRLLPLEVSVKKVAVLVLAVSLVVEPGCALLLRGTTQSVEVSGPGLEVDGVHEDAGTLELRRRQVHVISSVANGQRTTRTLESDIQPVWFGLDLLIFGFLLAPIGSVAFIVDFATGSLNEFETTEVTFDEKAPPPGQETECPQCGVRFAPGAKYCTECGARR